MNTNKVKKSWFLPFVGKFYIHKKTGYYNARYNFSVWIKICSNLLDINQFWINMGNRFLNYSVNIVITNQLCNFYLLRPQKGESNFKFYHMTLHWQNMRNNNSSIYATPQEGDTDHNKTCIRVLQIILNSITFEVILIYR